MIYPTTRDGDFGDPSADAGNPISPRQPYKPCGARKRDGTACRGAAMRNGRCRLHGGLTPGGTASPHFRHGKYSRYLKHLPQELSNQHEAARSDSDLLSLHDDLLVQTAMIMDLFQQLGAVEAPAWKEAAKQFRKYERARGSKDPAKEQAVLAALGEILRRGQDARTKEELLHKQIGEAWDQKLRLVRVEWKRLLDLRALVPWEQAVALLRGVVEAAREAITDPAALQWFGREVIRLLPPPTRIPLDIAAIVGGGEEGEGSAAPGSRGAIPGGLTHGSVPPGHRKQISAEVVLAMGDVISRATARHKTDASDAAGRPDGTAGGEL
jgi:hypothetical protein